MKSISLLRTPRSLITIALVILCVVFVGIVKWRTLAVHSDASEAQQISENESKRKFHERLGRGVGRIHLATNSDSLEDVRMSVNATADFIFERSNLKMSAETRQRLTEAEKKTLKGKTPRLSLDDLIDTLTETVVEQAKTLSDQEIDQAANTFQTTSSGEVISRADGRWGPITKDEFVRQMRSARDWAQRGEIALLESVRPLVKKEVDTCVDNLSEGLPDHFGRIREEGVSPIQATLIAYSVAADDPLDGSSSDTAEQIVKHRIETRQVKGSRRGSHKPYGSEGDLFSSPAHLLLDKSATKRLLDKYEGGKR